MWPPTDSGQQLSKLLFAVPTVLSLEKTAVELRSNSKACKQEKIVSTQPLETFNSDVSLASQIFGGVERSCIHLPPVVFLNNLKRQHDGMEN